MGANTVMPVDEFGNPGVTLRDPVTGGPATLSTGVTGTISSQTVASTTTTPGTLTFNPPIDGLAVQVRSTAGVGAIDDPDEAVLLTAGAPDSTVAADWLTESNIAPRVCVKAKDGIVVIGFDQPVSRIDYKAAGNSIALTTTFGGITA